MRRPPSRRNSPKRHSSRRNLIRNVIWGFLGLFFLTLVLVFLQFSLSASTIVGDAEIELNLAEEALSYSINYDDAVSTYDDYFKHNAQLSALLLSDETLSDEKLASVAGLLSNINTMLVFDADAQPLYTYGDPHVDQAFLLELYEARQCVTDDGFHYTAIPLNEELTLAIGVEMSFSEMTNIDPALLFSNFGALTDGMSHHLLIADLKTGKIFYGPDGFIGQNVMDMGYSSEYEATFGILNFEDIWYFSVFRHYQDQYLLASFTSNLGVVFSGFKSAIIPVLLGFGFLIVLTLAYAEFIRTDMRAGKITDIHYVQAGKKRFLNASLLRKLSGFALIGVTCILGVVFCSQLLVRLDVQRHYNERKLSIAESVLEKNLQQQQQTQTANQEAFLATSQWIREILAYKPDLMHIEDLSSLARIMGVSSIYVLDENGKTTCSSVPFKTFTLSSDPSNDSYPFWDVITGFSESHIQVIEKDPDNPQKETLYVGVPAADGSGMIRVGFTSESMTNLSLDFSIEDALSRITVDSQSMLLLVDAASGTCLYDSSDQYTEQVLTHYGINEKVLSGGYSGTLVFDDTNCLINTLAFEDWRILYVTLTDIISTSSVIFTGMVVVISMLVLALTVLPLLFVHKPGEDIAPIEIAPSKTFKRAHFNASFSSSGKIMLQEKQKEKNSFRSQWNSKNSGEKLRSVITFSMAVFAFWMLLSILSVTSSGEDSLISRIMQRSWDKSLNVYALTYVGISLMGIWFFAVVLQKLTLFVAETFSARWKTSGILISNIIRYVAFIASIFFTLQNFGVETSTLVTSASLMTLIFGLGSQSLIADLIAGVFLIFEGIFRVGDIVTIDGWRGEVIEIGLRATKVKNSVGNVKIFQNSRISGAVNMTSDETFAVCDITLPQGEQLEAFEQRLVTGFFPRAKAEIPSLAHPIMYEGVISAGVGSATLRISVRCSEGERENLQRALYRSLKLWSEQN